MSKKKQNKKYRILEKNIKNIECEISEMIATIKGYKVLNLSNCMTSTNNALDHLLHFVEKLNFRVLKDVLYVSYTLPTNSEPIKESYRLDGSATKNDLSNIVTLLNYISVLFVQMRQSCFCMMNNINLVLVFNEGKC